MSKGPTTRSSGSAARLAVFSPGNSPLRFAQFSTRGFARLPGRPDDCAAVRASASPAAQAVKDGSSATTAAQIDPLRTPLKIIIQLYTSSPEVARRQWITFGAVVIGCR
ncbi:hypothetical protein [Nonomuraea sp. NPDC001023]|uniref:hypothetical protein n=1 Tax=Nonomuraea sp. NPDC001023 TaxID=3154770 RepID=UPI003332336A